MYLIILRAIRCGIFCIDQSILGWHRLVLRLPEALNRIGRPLHIKWHSLKTLLGCSNLVKKIWFQVEDESYAIMPCSQKRSEEAVQSSQLLAQPDPGSLNA